MNSQAYNFRRYKGSTPSMLRKCWPEESHRGLTMAGALTPAGLGGCLHYG